MLKSMGKNRSLTGSRSRIPLLLPLGRPGSLRVSIWIVLSIGDRPLEQRKGRLEKLLGRSDGIRFAEHIGPFAESENEEQNHGHKQHGLGRIRPHTA
jgi:hypothetical protein